MTEPPRHLFVTGLHRSGTTMLARLLGAQASVSAFEDTGVMMDEGQHLQTVIPRSYDEPAWYSFHPRAHRTEASRLATEANGDRLAKEWGRYWNEDKPVLMEKSPGNLFRMRLLQRFFPRSAFIVLKRHPVPQALAMRKWQNPAPAPLALWNWARSYELAERDSGRLNRVMWLSYEELTDAPGRTLERLSGFLGLSLRPPDFTIEPAVNASYFEEWTRYRRAGLLQRMTSSLAMRRLESRIRRFGYSFEETFGSPAS